VVTSQSKPLATLSPVLAPDAEGVSEDEVVRRVNRISSIPPDAGQHGQRIRLADSSPVEVLGQRRVVALQPLGVHSAVPITGQARALEADQVVPLLAFGEAASTSKTRSARILRFGGHDGEPQRVRCVIPSGHPIPFCPPSSEV
jgi:hypothetical protein